MSLQDVVDALAAATGRAIDVEDRRFRLLAHSAHDGPVDAVRRDTILRRAATPAVVERLERLGVPAAREPVRLPPAVDLGMDARLCFPIRDRDRLLGFVWVLDDPSVPDGELAALAAAMAPIGTSLTALRAEEDERVTAEQQALEASLRGEPAGAVALLRERGPVVVAVARTAAALAPLRRSAGAGRALSGAHAGLAVLLSAGSSPGGGEDPALGVERVGLSGPVGGVGDAPEALRQATLALRIAEAVPALGPVARFAALGPYALLAPLAYADRPPPLPPALATLAGVPDAAELLGTLRAVLDAGDDVSGAAARLHVHRSTLHRRLQRVAQLTGADLADGRTRLELHAGLVLQELLGG